MVFDRYRERSVSHNVKDGYDFTDRVVTGGFAGHLVIGVYHQIGRVNGDEHDWIGSTQDNHGSDGCVQILVLVDQGERAVCKRAWDEHGVVHVNREFPVYGLFY